MTWGPQQFPDQRVTSRGRGRRDLISTLTQVGQPVAVGTPNARTRKRK